MSDNNLNLVDGKFYSFSFNGCACAGVFIKALKGDDEEDGFYCNGKAVCSLADAEQIKPLYSEGDLLSEHQKGLTAEEFREKSIVSWNRYDGKVDEIASLIEKEATLYGLHSRSYVGFVSDVAAYALEKQGIGVSSLVISNK
ncbi:hypothetical protein [Pseudoalteromonas sp. 1181_04]|uniref:hypothetical protein n=1 Tax=Pseudoalteromonas sp. 1181_04 TaxID=2604450 RepID=UPI0040640062